MKKKDEPKVWLTLLALLIGVLVIVGAVGLALWVSEKAETPTVMSKPSTSWGIANDSPIRQKR